MSENKVQTPWYLSPRLGHSLVLFTLLILIASVYWSQAKGTVFGSDEIGHYRLSIQPLNDIWSTVGKHAHPPLVFYSLHFWIFFLGEGLVTAKLFSVFFCFLAVVFAYLWVQELFGKRSALAMVLVLAISPLLISISAQVRSYSLMLFFEFASLYAMEKALKDGRSLRWFILFSFASSLSILAHYSGFLAYLIILGLTLLRSGFSLPRLKSRFLAGLAIFFPALVFLSFYFGFTKNPVKEAVHSCEKYLSVGYPRCETFRLSSVVGEFFNQIYGLRGSVLLLILLLSSLAAYWFRKYRSHRKLLVSFQDSRFLFLFVAPFLAISLAVLLSLTHQYPLVFIRHATYLLPFFLIVPVTALDGLIKQFEIKRFYLSLTLAALLLIPTNQMFGRSKYFRSSAEQRLHLLAKSAPLNSVILMDHEDFIAVSSSLGQLNGLSVTVSGRYLMTGGQRKYLSRMPCACLSRFPELRGEEILLNGVSHDGFGFEGVTSIFQSENSEFNLDRVILTDALSETCPELLSSENSLTHKDVKSILFQGSYICPRVKKAIEMNNKI